MFIHICTYPEMYIHLHTLYIQANVNTCMYMVCTCIYTYIQPYTSYQMYIHVYTMYIHVSPGPDLKVLSRYIQLKFYVQTGIYFFHKCTNTLKALTYMDVPFSFQLFGLPCWLACNPGRAGWPVISHWLLLGDIPIQAHQFNWYRALPSLAVTPSPCLCCTAGATAAAGSGAGAAIFVGAVHDVRAGGSHDFLRVAAQCRCPLVSCFQCLHCSPLELK